VIEAAFEQSVPVNLKFVGWAMARRCCAAQAGRRASDADLVLGLDTSLIAQPRKQGCSRLPQLMRKLRTCPVTWEDDQLAPLKTGAICFLSITPSDNRLANFRALADSDLKIVIQDPRPLPPVWVC